MAPRRSVFVQAEDPASILARHLEGLAAVGLGQRPNNEMKSGQGLET